MKCAIQLQRPLGTLRLLIIIAAVVSGYSANVGASQKPPAPSRDSLPTVPRDTSGDDEKGLAITPYVEYAPETGFVGGFMAIYFFQFIPDTTGKTARPSSFNTQDYYTQKNQVSTLLDFDLYFAHDEYHLSGGIDYDKYPFDFYGIGNKNGINPTDEYTPLWRGGDFQLTRNVIETEDGDGLDVGIGTEFRNDVILASDSGGPLQTQNVPGAHGGWSCGGGLVVNYDTRDNTFSSHTGNLISLNAYYYGRALGSSFTFSRYTLDVRQFVPVIQTYTLAFQELLVLANGTEPFYTMAGLGGNTNMRGYFEDRFRDKDMLVLQSEFRSPMLLWRFGFEAFADLGEVAGSPSELNLAGFKFSAGGGIRFTVVPEQHLGVRLDYGVGNGSSEVYFSILDAF